MIGWLKQLTTGKDNQTPCLGRISWAASMLVICAGGAWNAAHAAGIDLMQLAQAIGVIVLAHGGAIFVKADTEPEPAK